MRAAASVGIGAVRVYQWTLRPLIGANCRFWPSCSDYAIDALRLHGALHGTSAGDAAGAALQSMASRRRRPGAGPDHPRLTAA